MAKQERTAEQQAQIEKMDAAAEDAKKALKKLGPNLSAKDAAKWYQDNMATCGYKRLTKAFIEIYGK